MIIERALAKVNVTLRVTGRRPDGYHILDSIVVFAADCYDTVTVSQAEATHLDVSGTYARAVTADTSNLVLKALRWLEAYTGRSLPVRVQLHKEIPTGAGLGGGSADAAALLRAVQTLYGLSLDIADFLPELATIGADVPVCWHARAARLQGIGEEIRLLDTKPVGAALLINDGTHVPTASIFKNLTLPCDGGTTVTDSDAALRTGVNHLQDVAERLYPSLAKLRTTIAEAVRPYDASAVVRMTGSGSTYVLYTQKEAAITATRKALMRAYPAFWLRQTRFV